MPGARIALAETLLPRLAGEPALRAELLVALAADLYWVSVERSRAVSAEALDVARRAGLRAARAAAGAEESLRRLTGARSSDEGFLTYAVQLGAVRLLQGRLAELAPLLERGAGAYPRMVAFRTARLAAHLQEGERERARALLASVMPPGF